MRLACNILICCQLGSVGNVGDGSAVGMSSLNMALLKEGGAATTNAIIDVFDGDAAFRAFAKSETDGILARDAEDAQKV